MVPKSTTPRHRHDQPAKTRLIQAGERLFAQNGIDGVSMREIATAAKCGDTNAVTYHFGSKDGLIAAIFSARVQQMEVPRGRMLERAERDGKLADPLALISILFLPQLDLVDDEGRHPYASFMLHFATRHWADTSNLWSGVTKAAPNLQRLISLIVALIPEIPSEIVRSRALLGNMMLQSTLLRWDNAPDRTDVQLQARVRDVIISARAGLTVSATGAEQIMTSVDSWMGQAD